MSAPEHGIASQGGDFDLYNNELGNGTYDLFGNAGPNSGLTRKNKATDVPERSDGIENKAGRPSWAVSSAGDAPPIRTEAVSVKAQGESIFLGKILEVFPDISHEYVKNLYEKHNVNLGPGQDVTHIIEPAVDQILADGTYPKQKNRKRKREPADSESDSEEITKSRNVEGYSMLAVKALAWEFRFVPIPAIRTLFHEHKTLFATYEALYRLENSDGNRDRLPYEPLRRPRQYKGLWEWRQIEPELEKARKVVAKAEDKKRLQKQIEAAERYNEEEHAKAGALVECQCCFSEVPANRMIPCEGERMHFFCYTCVKTSAETQIGLMKYEMKCFDVSGCQAGFDRKLLKLAVGEAVMEKLESLQQLDEIAKAGLEGLEECAFCNYKAVCPPVEVDREFRCLNPDCEKVSCRLCKDETHIPKSCEEAKKEKGVTERHAVEEAMSEALIRTCPRCKINIIKENGCNKLQCVKCHCLICDVCKKDITREGYNHFTRSGCPLHENDQGVRRQKEEVKRAEQAAIEKIMAENSHLDRDALRVKVPEPKNDEVTRNRTAQQNMRPAARPPMPAAMNGAHPQRPPAYPLPAYPVRFPQIPPGPGLPLGIGPHIVGNGADPFPAPAQLGPGFLPGPRPYYPNRYGGFGHDLPPGHAFVPGQPGPLPNQLPRAGVTWKIPAPAGTNGPSRRQNSRYQH
ncbi:hypothetical protein VTN96DRAFT_5132 [Rasamsonia emersonii]